MTKNLHDARTPDETIATIMAAAHRLALQLADQGIFASVALSDATGEASCLTVTTPGDALPFHIQPMWPDADDYDEPCLELYIERVDTEWEPVPFAVQTEDLEGMEDDLQTMFEVISKEA